MVGARGGEVTTGRSSKQKLRKGKLSSFISLVIKFEGILRLANKNVSND